MCVTTREASSVSFQRISEQDDLFLSSFTTTKIMDMAKPDIQFPADGDEGVIRHLKGLIPRALFLGEMRNISPVSFEL